MLFPVYRQHDAADCGPTCVRMIARYYGKSVSAQLLRERCAVSRLGVSLRGISSAAESIGFRTLAARVPYDVLVKQVPLPCIAHWQQNHFVVVYRATRRSVWVADPSLGAVKYTRDEFLAGWLPADGTGGIVLLLEPTPALQREEAEPASRPRGLAFVTSYLARYTRYIVQLVLGVFFACVLNLIFPFLTQAIVDVGIANQDLGFVYTVLLAHVMLFVSQMSVEFLQSWLLLHISARVNIAIVSDFLAKLMQLPLPFFEARTAGDLLQRVDDHRRIEHALTTSSLGVLLALLNLVMFSIVLLMYSVKIFAVFAGGTLLALGWLVLFLRARRALDMQRFARTAENRGRLIQIILGLPELKLNNAERLKRWEWEHGQAALFKLNVRALSLAQIQNAGVLFILKAKDIAVTFLAAMLVIDGRISLGMMLAIQYIVGQLSAPLEQFMRFIHTAQDAALSAERLGEIQTLPNEEQPPDELSAAAAAQSASLVIDHLTFRYHPEAEPVLRDISFTIPHGKVTALVGASGSGKTTLLKLLLKMYEPTSGEIRLGDTRLKHIPASLWRARCGVVLQDGRLFSDTIARNIALGDDTPDVERVLAAARIAAIHDDIQQLPLGYNTKVGPDGHGLSQGQTQRLLIARAVYRQPAYLMLDEATSALDADNERQIIEQLRAFCAGRTVLVIAHRLSTVQHADQVIVLARGAIAERGTHDELVAARGVYYQLVRNQLSLGT